LLSSARPLEGRDTPLRDGMTKPKIPSDPLIFLFLC